jgi:hypothetical protein
VSDLEKNEAEELRKGPGFTSENHMCAQRFPTLVVALTKPTSGSEITPPPKRIDASGWQQAANTCDRHAPDRDHP